MTDDIDLFKTFGEPQKGSNGQQTTSAKPAGVDMSMFGSKPGVLPDQAQQESQTETSDPYEQQVRGLAPRAEEEIKKGGYKRAVEASSIGAPIIGPAVGAVARGAKATYETLTGDKSIGENYNRLSAEDEALRRAANKMYPITSAASEIGGSLAMPMGEIAAPFVAGSKLMGPVSSLAMKGLGYGAEAGVYGAGSAAAEQAFGTQSKENQPSLLESATTGAELGAGLGVGGTLLGRLYNKTISPMLGAVAPESVSKALGFKTANQSIRDSLIDEAVKVSEAEGDHAPSRKTIDYVLDQEAKAGIPVEKSIVNNLDLFPANSHKAILGEYSTDNPKIRQEFDKIFNNAKERASNLGTKADILLDDMHNEAAMNALNAQRDARGITEHIVEPPSAEELRSLADEVRKGAWEREVQPIYDNHQSVNSDILSTMLPIIDERIVGKAQNDMNVLRQTRGQQPYNFLSTDENGKWHVMGHGAQSYTTPFYQNLARKAGESEGVAAGAPLEFWDMLAGQLQGSQNKADQAIGQQIREGVEQYFSKKGLSNELKTAKDSFRGIRGEGNAVTAGMKFVNDGAYQTNPAKRQAFLNRWNKLTDTEKGLYQAGVMQQIYSTIRQGQKGFSDWQRILKDDQNSKLLQEVLNFRPTTAGELSQGALTNYEKLQAAMEIGKYAKMQAQMENLAQTPKARAYYSRFGIPGDIPFPESLLVAAERSYYYGPAALAAYGLRGVYGYGRQLFQDAKARQYLRIMSEQNPAKIRELADEVARAKQMGPSWKKYRNYVDALKNSSEKNYRKIVRAVSAPPYQTGGRVGYQDGGEIAPGDPRAMIKQLVSRRDALTPGTPEHQNVIDQIRQHSQAMAQVRQKPQAPVIPAMRTPQLDESGMYSPSVKAILDTHQSDPTHLSTQYSPAEALQRAIRHGADRYELFHSNLMEENGAPGKHLQGVNNLSMGQLADLLEQHSPKPQPHVYTGSNAVHTHMTSYWLPQDNKDQYEVAVKAPGRAGEPEKKKGFIPPIHLKQSDKDVELLDRFGYNHGYVWDENASTVPQQKIEARLKMEQDNADEKANAPYYFSNTSHYPQVPENRVMHTRGQVIEKKYVPEDINSILNEDETQSDFNARYREDQTYDKRHKTKDRHVYDPDEHRNLYDAAVKSEEELKKVEQELANAKKFGMQVPSDLLQKHSIFFSQAYNDRGKYRDYRHNVKRYPELPFGDDEDKYTRLANNLTVNRAINGGHDAVSWTPWQNQIVRNQRGMPVSGFNVVPIKNEFGRNLIRIYEKPWPGAEDQTKLHIDVFDVNNEDFEKNLATNFGKHAAKEMVKRLAVNPDGFNLDWKEEEPAKQGGKGSKTVYHPLFIATGDEAREREENAKKADKTIEYYGKTKSRIYRSMFHEHDPSMDIDNELFYHPEARSGLKFPHPGFKMTPKFVASVKGKGLRRFRQGGEVERPQRATGGRIPEVDKLFKAAKKELDNSTKPMLNIHDDHIVNALRIAQGRI